MARLIYAVDDDEPIRALLKQNLEREGYRAEMFPDAASLLRAASTMLPDLFLLDWMMPGMDGLQLCKALREGEATARIPIIMLTARDQEVDMILGLEMGADDYIAKPFSLRELTTRMRAIFRRIERLSEPDGAGVSRCGAVVMDAPARRVTVDGAEIPLTLKEFELLKMLMDGHGSVLTRELLLERIWGFDYGGGTRTVDVHIMQLRKRLGQRENYIDTVRGLGYKMTAKEGL